MTLTIHLRYLVQLGHLILLNSAMQMAGSVGYLPQICHKVGIRKTSKNRIKSRKIGTYKLAVAEVADGFRSFLYVFLR